MGSCFQTVVDRDATETEAPALGDLIHRWLVDEGIVFSVATDCILGPDRGFPPGPEHHKATGDPYEYVLGCNPNGLEIVTERTVFYSLQGGDELVCSLCSGRFEPTDEWQNAINQWWSREGEGSLACLHCGVYQPITEWEHDPPWGFANLGFTFWNWTPLREDFVEEFRKRLGHRVVLVAGKL